MKSIKLFLENILLLNAGGKKNMFFYKKEFDRGVLKLFVRDCNFRCSGCNNYYRKIRDCFTFEDISLEGVKKVIFLGGEPTLNKNFDQICRKLKENNISVELQTNGWFPCVIQDLCEKKLVDEVVEKIVENPDNTKYEDGMEISEVEYFSKQFKTEFWCNTNKIKFNSKSCNKD